MYGQTEAQTEEDLGYECDQRHGHVAVAERRYLAAARQLSGQERRSQQSRYSRRPAPTRSSGAHRRGNKRYGV